jgi:hypothetical protein
MRYKKISDFPKQPTGNAEVLGLKDGSNIRIEVMSRFDTIDAIAKVNVRSKGYFRSLDALIAAYPTGVVGDRAYVGINTPYSIYEWDGTQWYNTGELGGGDVSNITTGATSDTTNYEDIF